MSMSQGQYCYSCQSHCCPHVGRAFGASQSTQASISEYYAQLCAISGTSQFSTGFPASDQYDAKKKTNKLLLLLR